MSDGAIRSVRTRDAMLALNGPPSERKPGRNDLTRINELFSMVGRGLVLGNGSDFVDIDVELPPKPEREPVFEDVLETLQNVIADSDDGGYIGPGYDYWRDWSASNIYQEDKSALCFDLWGKKYRIRLEEVS